MKPDARKVGATAPAKASLCWMGPPSSRLSVAAFLSLGHDEHGYDDGCENAAQRNCEDRGDG